MEIERLVRRTAVGGFIVAGGVVAAQSAASAQEAPSTPSEPASKATPAKKRVLEEKAPASKAATAARAKKAAAASTKKPGTKKPSSTPATTKPAPTKPSTSTRPLTEPAAVPAAATAVVATAPAAPVAPTPTPAPATAQTAVAVEAPPAPLPPVDAPVDGEGPATEVTLVPSQTSADATTAQEVSADQPVAAGPPPPEDTTTAANALLTSSTTPNASTAALTGTSPNGQITITINQPAPGTVVAPGTPVVVTGTVSVGGASATNVIYVIDVSGSTSGSGGSCGDPNGDGSADTILDCEIAGITALNNSLGNAPIDVSLVTFSSGGVPADLSTAPGDQFTTRPTTDSNGNGVPDIVEVLNSQTPGGGTNFDAALAAVQGLLVPGEQNIVFFLSDGQSSLATGPGSPLQAVADAGATVLTFAVGTGTSGCAAGEPLADIAAATGGTCTEVTNPAQLSATLTGVSLAGIDRVEIEVNGFVGVATLSPLGFFTITIPPDILLPGQNAIIARAFGAGDQAGQIAVADTSVTVGAGGVRGAGLDFDEFFLDFDLFEVDHDFEADHLGILPVTGSGAGHKAATGALSFLLGGLFLGGGRHLRRRRRLQIGA